MSYEEYSVRSKEPVLYCDECKEGIYNHDFYYLHNGLNYCEDCFDDLLDEMEKEARREADIQDMEEWKLEIKEMDNQILLRNYGCLLKEIDNNYKVRKEFEEEIKKRFTEGRI